MMPPSSKTAKRLTGSVIAIIVLTVCLAVTTSALTSITVMLGDNAFTTGLIDIEIEMGEDGIGNKIIDGECIAPGMTIEKTFTIINYSTDDVYYKLYFENIVGGLQDLILVTIRDGNTVLDGYNGVILSTLTEKRAPAVNVPIPKQNPADTTEAHTKELTICFHLPSDVEESAQTMDLSFDFSVRAVQSRNNNINDKIYFGDEEETSAASDSSETSAADTPPENEGPATNQ